jgi:hypothetical protein
LVVRRLDEAAEIPLEDITTETIERWRDSWIAGERPSNRTVQKYLVVLGSIFRHAKRRGLRSNRLDDVERPRVRSKVEIDCPLPGRGGLPDCGLHRPAPGRAARAALARRRLRAPGDPPPPHL